MPQMHPFNPEPLHYFSSSNVFNLPVPRVRMPQQPLFQEPREMHVMQHMLASLDDLEQHVLNQPNQPQQQFHF